MLAVIGVAAITFFLYSLTRIPTVEQAPCSACPGASEAVPQVSVCELDGQGLGKQVVRVRGMFYNDAAQLFLRDGNCTVMVGLVKPIRACRGAWRKFQMVTGTGTWYDGKASVTMTGSMGRIPEPNYFAGKEGFNVLCLESVQTQAQARERWNFLFHRLFPFGDPYR
jgi:hypothetical protein